MNSLVSYLLVILANRLLNSLNGSSVQIWENLAKVMRVSVHFRIFFNEIMKLKL